MKSFINLDYDATVIEILPEDEIPEDKYLYPDMNYINGYEQYIKMEVYTAGYPRVDAYNGEKHFSTGMIKVLKDKKGHFSHDCPTKKGSSGSPLLNISQQVIGIHYGCNERQTMNFGIFIGEIIENLKKDENNIILKGNLINKINIINIKRKEKEKKSNPDIIDFKNTNLAEDNNIIKIKKKKKAKEIIKVNEKEEDKINKKEDPKKPEDILLINALSKGEQKKKNFKPIKESDMALVGMIFNNPSFMNIIKTMYKNPIMAEYLNNTPEIKKLKEKNPIFKEVLGNPELLDKLFTPDLFNTYAQMASMINNNEDEEDKKEDIKINNKNDTMNQQNDINNLLGNINFINGLNDNNNIVNPQLDKNNEKKEINLNLGNNINDNLNLNNNQGDDNQKNRKKY